MDDIGKRGLKIFLEFWILIGALAAFNFYNYSRNGSKLFLAVAILCVVGFVVWAVAYFFYFRRPRGDGGTEG
jgi:hypothetical protein